MKLPIFAACAALFAILMLWLFGPIAIPSIIVTILITGAFNFIKVPPRNPWMPIALALGLLLMPGFALALDTSTGSTLDLAPLLNPLIQAAGAIVAGAVSAIALMLINWLRQKMKLDKITNEAALQAKIDTAAQTAIGGAISRAQIPEGKHVLDFKHKIIADAAQKLAAGFGETLREAGSKNNIEKAKEIVENRLGMMAAEAKGTPIPNPSKPETAAPVPVPVIVPATNLK